MLALAEGSQNATWLTAIIGATGLILGALATALSSAWSASRKIKEVQLVYQQKLQDGYLENARAHAQVLYLPVSSALSALSQAYQRLSINECSTSSARQVNKFRNEIESFKSTFLELERLGHTLFLTTALEEEIEEFIITLDECLDAEEVEWRTVLKLTPWGPEYEWITSRKMASEIARIYSLHGNVFESRVLVAPVDSAEFGEFFLSAVKNIRILIKEVTLGAQAVA
jgi:hypothetical protein